MQKKDFICVEASHCCNENILYKGAICVAIAANWKQGTMPCDTKAGNIKNICQQQ